MRYGDGIRRGNWFTNLIIGSLQIPVLGAFNSWLENKMVLGKIMGGGYHDARKLPPDLLTELNEVAQRPGYKRAARKVLAGWQSWSKARDQYRAISAPVTLIYGDCIGRAPTNGSGRRRCSPARVWSHSKIPATSHRLRIQPKWRASYWGPRQYELHGQAFSKTAQTT
jgi:hypothetical protein